MKHPKLKKAISMLLAFALVFGIASVSTFAAAATPLFEVADVQTRQGEEFEVTITFARNISKSLDPIAALDVSLIYNSEIYSVVSMENGQGLNKALEAVSSGNINLENNYIFSTSANVAGEVKWSLVTLDSFTFVKGEEFMTVRFKANDRSDLTKDPNMTIKVTNAAAPSSLSNITSKFSSYTNDMDVEVNLTTLCDWEYVEALGGYRLVKFNGENASTFTIPDEYDDPNDDKGACPVMSIGSGAFRNCTTITKISLNKNIAEVGTAAFMYCESLEKVVVFSADTKFGANSLYGTSDKFVLKCIEGSVADAYAQKWGYAVEYFEDVADCVYTGVDEDVYYTGSPVEFTDLKVYNSDNELMNIGADYVIYYTDNVEIGTAKLIVTGRGEYLGTKEIEFSILCPYHTSESTYYTEEIIYADCEKDGYIIKDCSYCEYHDETTVAPAKAHGELVDVVDADSTCTAAGIMNHICKDCAKVISTSEIAIKDHAEPETETWVVVTPATCGVAGKEVKYCANCEYVLEEREIPALTHNHIEKLVKEPTCKDTGIKALVCENCGDTLNEEEVAAVDHDMKWIVTTEPTCTEKGIETYQCRFCGYYEGEVAQTSEVDATGHEMGDWVTLTAASCKEAGVEARSCIHCSQNTEYKAIDKLAHTETWVTYSELSCTTDEHKVKYCSVCEEELEVIKTTAPGHTDGEWVTVTELTCTQDGLKEHYCATCREVYETEVVKASGHKSGEWVTIPATCAREGAYEHHCAECDEVYESTPIEKLAHTEGEWEVVIEPSCILAGMKHKVCSVCGEALETEEIAATGHTIVRVTETLPTYRFEGKDKAICGDCGEFIRYIPTKKLSSDIDGNGKTTSADALLILQHATGLRNLEGEQLRNANLDGNGGVNSADALIVLQIATGLITV